MQGHTLDELHQSFWVGHLYISIKKMYVCPCVHVEARGWYQLFSLVLLCLIFDTGFSLSLELMNSARVPGRYAPGSVTACSRAGVAEACCPIWHFMWDLDSALMLAQWFTNWASLQALHQHLCSKVEAFAPGEGLCREACASRWPFLGDTAFWSNLAWFRLYSS